MTLQTIAPFTIDRAGLVSWYRRNRNRSQALFDLLVNEAYTANLLHCGTLSSSTRVTSQRSASIRW